jgi:hypothetical protein
LKFSPDFFFGFAVAVAEVLVACREAAISSLVESGGSGTSGALRNSIDRRFEFGSLFGLETLSLNST